MKIQVLMLGLLLSCGQLNAEAMHDVSAQVMVHHGKGKVVSVDKANYSVKLAHEPIKSLHWPGMTMDFSVMKTVSLEGLKTGDMLSFDLAKEGKSDQWQIMRITAPSAK
jgi:Cu/Ag efflux protein CusF